MRRFEKERNEDAFCHNELSRISYFKRAGKRLLPQDVGCMKRALLIEIISTRRGDDVISMEAFGVR